MSKTRPYSLQVILYSEANPILSDIIFSAELGQKRVVSKDIDYIWDCLSYRLKTVKGTRILFLIPPKKVKQSVKDQFKGVIKWAFNLTDILRLPTKHLELYDSIDIDGANPDEHSTPPPYVGPPRGENCMPHMHDNNRDLPSHTGDEDAVLLNNTFYRLSLQS